MRKLNLVGALAIGFVAAGVAVPTGAGAMTIAAPAALEHAVPTKATDAAYVCRRWWGWGRWHRACSWRPGPYAYYGYGHSWRYYHRPYYRRWSYY